MTTLKQAAQQALEALEREIDTRRCKVSTLRAMNALRAALAEPVQEPVAWIQPDHLQKARKAPFLCRVEPTKRMVDFVPLYAVPPQRKPLTEDEIDAIDLPPSGTATVRDFVRIIERAHGIT